MRDKYDFNDPMDVAKEQKIEQAKQAPRTNHYYPYDQSQSGRAACCGELASDLVRQGDALTGIAPMVNCPMVAFAPHCPVCYAPTERERIRFRCRRCGLRFERSAALMLRPLPPQPAPPYTQSEIEQLYEVYQ